MEIRVFCTSSDATETAAQELWDGIRQYGEMPDFVSLHPSVNYDLAAFQAKARDWGATALHGSTSSRGVMSGRGMHSRNDTGAGAFCIWDKDGHYGTAMRPLGDDPKAAAIAATRAALQNAGRPEEAPDMVWLSTAPSNEEPVLKGIEAVVGAKVPVFGASAADNDVSGNWRVFDRDGFEKDGVVVSVLFPSGEMTVVYQNGYTPTEQSGVVTRAKRRRLYEIDGEPAAQVYDRWTGGAVVPKSASADWITFLRATTFQPLGRYLESVGRVPYYLLAQPSFVYPDGSLGVFSDIAEGDRLIQMTGSADGLIERPGKVARLAARLSAVEDSTIKGALMVCCAGWMDNVQDQMDEVAAKVGAALEGVPMLGVFSFGEQGMVLGDQNHHGNLMVSCLMFS